MRTFHLSPLGFLMKSLRIQTVTLARSLHVDASLVSKWKSGDRRLTERSVCFDDVVSFILNYAQQSPQQFYDTLSKAMPMEDITNKSNLKTVLRKMLATPNWQIKNQAIDSLNSDIPKTTISLFDGADGMRRAVSSLLKFAEKLPYAGEIIFIDTSDYRWLVTDESYTANFTNRLIKLLARGFRIRFVIHYSANHEHSIQLFTAVSPLIFHRNVDWYYYEYYDDTLFDSSLFILKHTISLLNITSERIPASTMAFTDISLVMRHESLAEHIIGQCRPIFENFLSQDFWQILKNVCQLRRRGAFYAYLPSPAFIFAQENILSAILDDNHLSESDKMDCITLNKSGFQSMQQKKEPFIYILQLEEMERRIHNQPFISTSLSLLSSIQLKFSLIIMHVNFAFLLKTLFIMITFALSLFLKRTI